MLGAPPASEVVSQFSRRSVCDLVPRLGVAIDGSPTSVVNGHVGSREASSTGAFSLAWYFPDAPGDLTSSVMVVSHSILSSNLHQKHIDENVP